MIGNRPQQPEFILLIFG